MECALERVGLAAEGARAVGLPSVGEYNYLALARALLGDPGPMVLDEQENHLDFTLTAGDSAAACGTVCACETGSREGR